MAGEVCRVILMKITTQGRSSALPASRPARFAAFTALAELDYNPDGSVSDEQYAAAFLAVEHTHVTRNGTPVSRHEAIIMVRRWFAEPEFWTPFIDDVAIERAMDLDEDVLDRLSGDEVAELGRRLARLPEPFGEQLIVNQHGPAGMQALTPRQIRFRALSPRWQEYLPREVAKWKKVAA